MNSLLTQRRRPGSSAVAPLKSGRAETSLIRETMGPGMPVPPMSEPPEPAMSLTI